MVEAFDAIIVIAVFLSLLIFIIWDSVINRQGTAKPVSRQQMERGYMPGQMHAPIAGFGGSILSGAFAFKEFYEPSYPPNSGRGAFLQRVVFDLFGDYGMALFFLSLALFLAWSSWLLYKKNCSS